MLKITKAHNYSLKLTYWALIILACSVFTSVSASALFHILIALPSLFFIFTIKNKQNFKIPYSFYFLLTFFLVCLGSVIVNIDTIARPLDNILKTKYLFIALISCFSFFHLKEQYLTDKRKKLLINLFIFSTTVATVCGLIGLWTGYTPLKFKAACHARRACGLYGMYMTYGYGISFFVSLATGVLLSKNKIKALLNSKFLCVTTFINFFGMIFSYARGGWLGFLLSFPFLYFQKSKKTFTLIFLGLGLSFVIALVSSDRIQHVFMKRVGSNQERLSHFSGAWSAFKESPILGVGYRNYEALSTKIKIRNSVEMPDKSGHAHSNYLEHLASTGILGFVSFLLFVAFWLYESLATPYLFIFVLNFFISGFTQYTFGDGENLFLILALYSLSAFKSDPNHSKDKTLAPI